MRRTLLLGFVSALNAGCERCSEPLPPAPAEPRTDALAAMSAAEPPPGSRLLFAEEFDGTTLNRKRWCTRYIYGGGPRTQHADPECETRGEGNLDFLNDELQRYRDTSSSGAALHQLSNGVLTLVAEVGPGVPRYESAMIRSKRLFLPKAGSSLYIVGRVKLPSVRGTWPALWLNSDRDPNGKLRWPPEIDLFEAPLNGKEDRENMLHMGAVARAPQKKQLTFTHPDFARRWRNYVAPRSLRDVWLTTAIEWTPESVCYFVDGIRVMCEAYRWQRRDGTPAPPAHLLANLAIGGEWAGRHGVDDARFPARFSIDYLRVYERAASAAAGSG